MQELHVFEYAVIRLVPKVEREEFMNLGVVLYCGKTKFLNLHFHLDKQRLKAFSPMLDLEEIQDYLTAFGMVCSGSRRGGPIAALPMPDRFRWLTATRSTIIQTFRVHVGLCKDPSTKLDDLFHQMVLL